ncbi:NIPSNAP family protein [Mucilaginibacter xinganensis]|uniref:NIPSNAP family containing protein n=1 Tax=Mucilaginibacter xinganensis TaxID=1234841 RepID=A0A223NYM5_9SPHI|nr:NIPSNAP family protein [Mucilaginibacter xinganensis]ASU34963.1 NIPSNAP family containing protein [Mucilaginibacter xinganensis]
MEQLRIYTLADKETAAHYFTVNWSKHRINLPRFGFEVKGVWIGNTPGIANQVIALISFPDNADVERMTERYLKSPEFANDTAGFDRNKITNVETKILRSAG